MGRLHVTIVVVQKQKVSHILRVCICSLRYSACNAYAPFCLFFFSCPALQCLSKLSHKRHDFRKEKFIEHKMCILILICRILSDTFLILRRNERNMIKNVDWSSCKLPVILV